MPILVSGVCGDCESVLALDARITDEQIERLIALEVMLPYLDGRDAEIVFARLQGDSWREIGRAHGLGPDRPRKICKKIASLGLDMMP